MARIGYISFHTSPLDSPGSRDAGGMNVVEMEHARALAALGHDVELVTRRDDPNTPDVTEVCGGVRVRQISAGPAEQLAKSAQEAHIEEFSAALAASEPYDLLHSHHWMSGVAALPVARAWGVPHVQSYHSVAALPGNELSEGEPPESPGRNEGERYIARESDLVIAVSDYEARTIIERCGADSARVEVIYPGVDTDLFHPLDSTLDAGTQQHVNLADLLPCARNNAGQWPAHGYVLFAARLQPLKGPDLALRALAGIPAEIRPDIVMTGDVSQDFHDYKRELDELCEELGIASQVRWCGPRTRTDLATLMRGARIMLVPSYSETFGLVALEANASGTPVIAADSGGLREAIADGTTGILMHTRSPHEWSRAITELLEDEQQRSRMGHAGRAHALNLSWAAGAQRLDAAYHRLLGESQSTPQEPR